MLTDEQLIAIIALAVITFLYFMGNYCIEYFATASGPACILTPRFPPAGADQKTVNAYLSESNLINTIRQLDSDLQVVNNNVQTLNRAIAAGSPDIKTLKPVLSNGINSILQAVKGIVNKSTQNVTNAVPETLDNAKCLQKLSNNYLSTINTLSNTVIAPLLKQVDMLSPCYSKCTSGDDNYDVKVCGTCRGLYNTDPATYSLTSCNKRRSAYFNMNNSNKDDILACGCVHKVDYGKHYPSIDWKDKKVCGGTTPVITAAQGTALAQITNLNKTLAEKQVLIKQVLAASGPVTINSSGQVVTSSTSNSVQMPAPATSTKKFIVR